MKHTFHTPQPLRIAVRNAAGQVELTCLETTQTEVVVEPAGRDGIEFAEQTTVVQDGDQLRIEVPEKRWGRAPKILVRVSAPAGSELDARTASADVECVGMVSGLTVSGASGDVLAELVEGDASVQLVSGAVRIGTVAGETRVRTASGDVTAARLGTLEVSTASGDVTVGTLGGRLLAKTASGDVQVADASAGAVEATTASGDITVAIRQGTAVRLELSTVSGDLRSDLPVDDQQPQGGEDLQLRLRSISGDVLVRRAGAAPGSGPATDPTQP